MKCLNCGMVNVTLGMIAPCEFHGGEHEWILNAEEARAAAITELADYGYANCGRVEGSRASELMRGIAAMILKAKEMP